jgi:hypothetical protein
VERHCAEGVGQRLLVPTGAKTGVSSWGRGGLLVQQLLLLQLWPGQEAGRHVEARCGHEGLRTPLSSGHGAGVHSHVPLPWVVVGRPRCVGPTIRNRGGGGLARRATTTSAAGAILALVAATMTAIAVFVVILGGCHWRRRCRHWAGETASKTAAWLPGTQHWCRAPSGQPEARYCPCKSLPGADLPKL